MEYKQREENLFENNKINFVANNSIKYNADSLNTFSINNRRYLGNKYKLNNFIRTTILKECKKFETFADLFAGTGAVASLFQDKKLIINDILYSNYVCYQTWFGADNYDIKKIKNYLKKYNLIYSASENYFSKNYSNTYFNNKNCKKIGFIREDIEKNFKNKNINTRERCILITSLLYAMDKIANTCGHYDAYRKNGELEKELILGMPDINTTNSKNRLFNEDINNLVKNIEADVVYLDPPYNSRQYCDAYHLLENVARWQKPDIYGIAKKMNRDSLKSAYCTTNATKAFEDLINNIKANYIILSYNNMANKGNSRSNAKLSDEDIINILKVKGKLKIFSQKYKSFSAGKSDIKENEERLFICKCF